MSQKWCKMFQVGGQWFINQKYITKVYLKKLIRKEDAFLILKLFLALRSKLV